MINEGRLISAVINNKDIAPVLNSQNVEMLFPSHADIWDFIKNYYIQNRQIVPLQILSENFKDFQILPKDETSGTVKHYLEQLRDEFTTNILGRISVGLSKEVGIRSNKDLIRKLTSAVSDLNKISTGIKDLDITDSEKSMEHYSEMKRLMELNGGVMGIRSGFDSIDASYPTGFAPGQVVMILSRTNQGKRLRIDEPIPTPNGWTTMQYLRAGDKVFGRDGKSCNVIAVSEIDPNPNSYKVILSDGAEIEADLDHQWVTTTYLERRKNENPKIRTTKEILSTLRHNGRINHAIPKNAAIELPEQELEIDPYVLGMGLTENKNLNDKCIPNKYLRASIAQRMNLLRGLMDGAGTTSGTKSELCFTDKKLSEDATELMRSLGIRVSCKVVHKGLKYRMSFVSTECPFSIPAKVEKWKPVNESRNAHRTIRDIVPVISSPMRCITVDSKDNTYIAGKDWIVTHNSWFALDLAINAWAQAKKILYVSLEMSSSSVRDRAYTFMSKGEFKMSDLSRAQIDLDAMKLWTNTNMQTNGSFVVTSSDGMGDFSPAQLQGKIEQYGADIVFVDYLQLMTDNKESSGETERIRRISKELKSLSMSSEIPIVIVAASSFNETKEYNKPPEIFEVAGSKQAAYDYDLVLSMFSHKQNDGSLRTEIVARKNRNGPLFDFVVKLDIENGTITEEWNNDSLFDDE